jgi:hypothetical protein
MTMTKTALRLANKNVNLVTLSWKTARTLSQHHSVVKDTFDWTMNRASTDAFSPFKVRYRQTMWMAQDDTSQAEKVAIQF